MATVDSTIGQLPAAPSVDDESLFVLEQQGAAMKATGAQWKGFAQAAVTPQVTAAQQSATSAAQSAAAAAQSATEAAQSATEAASSADTAQQYSGKPPIIQNGTWWTWNATTQQYEDTGDTANGNVLYATFAVDPSTGILTMTTPDGYTGPTFMLVNGHLEVSIGA